MSKHNSVRPYLIGLCATALGAFIAVNSRSATNAIAENGAGNVTAALATAQPTQEHAMTLEQAVAMVEAKYKARALRYNTVDEDGHSIHYIRLITSGRERVFTVRVDAATGQELPQLTQ